MTDTVTGKAKELDTITGNKLIAEEEKIVKISTCSVCNGVVRAAVKDYVLTDKHAKKEFFNEVKKYNLNVSEMSLNKYRESATWCSCKK